MFIYIFFCVISSDDLKGQSKQVAVGKYIGNSTTIEPKAL